MAEKFVRIEDLLVERKKEHGEAWRWGSELFVQLLNVMPPKVWLDFVTDAPQFVYLIVIILSKVTRAVFSPFNIDHWRDIAGYATLAVNEIQKLEIDIQKEG